MSPHNNNNKSPPVKPEKPETAGRKPQSAKAPHAPSLNCPRCDSPNTKFCYYNNYNLSQPRHFCKTCRRYWTKGGALRNVPIGGGSRKNKMNKSLATVATAGGGDGGLKLFHGLSPAMDFHRPNPRSAFNPFSSIGDFLSGGASDFSNPNPISGSGLFHSSSLLKQGENGKPLGFHGMGGLNLESHLTPSIESLSSLNQDLHLKLQQQRLAMVFGSNIDHQREHFVQKPHAIHFQNLDNEMMRSCPISTSIENNNDNNNNNWIGIQTWNELADHFPLM